MVRRLCSDGDGSSWGRPGRARHSPWTPPATPGSTAVGRWSAARSRPALPSHSPTAPASPPSPSTSCWATSTIDTAVRGMRGGLAAERTTLYPTWQFANSSVRSEVADIIRAFRERLAGKYDARLVASWANAPQPELDHATPSHWPSDGGPGTRGAGSLARSRRSDALIGLQELQTHWDRARADRGPLHVVFVRLGLRALLPVARPTTIVGEREDRDQPMRMQVRDLVWEARHRHPARRLLATEGVADWCSGVRPRGDVFDRSVHRAQELETEAGVLVLVPRAASSSSAAARGSTRTRLLTFA
jgi:hypothetical protein